MIKRTPIGRNKSKAQQYLKDAIQQKAEGFVVQAANSIRLALVLDPENEEMKVFAQTVQPKAADIRAEKEYKRGQGAESMGRSEEALSAYRRAIEASPTDARSFHGAANLLLDLNRDLREAAGFCREARRLEPDNDKVRLTLGQLFIKLGMKKNALRELTAYVATQPLDEYAGRVLRDLKKAM